MNPNTTVIEKANGSVIAAIKQALIDKSERHKDLMKKVDRAFIDKLKTSKVEK